MKISPLMERVLTIVEMYFRRSPAGALLSVGSLLMLGGSSLALKLSFNKKGADGEFIAGEISTADQEWWVTAVCLGLGGLLVAIGLYLSWVLFLDQRHKRVIAVELRGLKQTIDTPLETAIPRRVMGVRESILIDVRDLVDGTDEQKKMAVGAVNNLPQLLKQKKDGRDRSDLTVYAGGLAPVPLLFLSGTLFAAESTINWLDWDRKALNWVSPASGTDLPNLLPVNITSGKIDDAVLVVSVSYPVDLKEVDQSFPGVPIAELKLGEAYPGLVVSEESIQVMMQQFMEAIVSLQRFGVKKIHLVLAAPSILSMRLGTSYAGRNMPALIVYQYQRAQAENPYPWGVMMPNSEIPYGEFIKNEILESAI
jgi:hypothetical protein